MRQLLLTAAAWLALSSCSVFRPAGTDNGKIDISFVQVNDVYEIAPLNGGREGGLARVATLKKTVKQKNPNTWLVMAGDFLSPSIYNSLQYNGKAVRGRQMVEALNAAGLDIAVFGNHEFDIRESELQERINESAFRWVSTNAFHKTVNGVASFQKAGGEIFPKTWVLTATDADGTTARIGLLTALLPFNRADYVHYTDALQAATEAYNQLKDSVDAVVAITHQSMEADEQLARALPGLAAIIGGHEHDQRFAKVGDVTISKAMANAKNAYVLTLRINKRNQRHKLKASLEPLNEHVPLDSATNAVVQKWNKIADDNYSSLGFDARRVMISKGGPFDGRETEVRSKPTALTRLVLAAIKEAAPAANLALLNGGSIRVDDVLQPPVTQYDILRTLPFGGAVAQADLKGSLLQQVLESGRNNVGIGGFLQTTENVHYQDGRWLLNGTAIDSAATYRVALPEFLLSGKEANMAYLVPTNPGVVKVYPSAAKGESLSDVRLAVVRYLEKHRADYVQ